ncbi:MAG: peptidase S41 [Ferruginibacter sp.]|nr:peptidase S41 [Cytophagales bacterium]
MKTLLCLLLLASLLGNAQPGTDTLQTKFLQPADMQADFRYLRRLLEETHPGLYRYTPKVIMQAKLDSLAATLDRPLPFYDFFRSIAALIADVRCAHTHAVPTKEWQKQYLSNWKALPLLMIQIQNRSYVWFNGTNDQTVEPGFEFLSINGQSMAQIRQTLYRYHWDDGYIQTAKDAALRLHLFPAFYYWFIDRPDTYQLTLRNLRGDTVQVNVPGQPYAESAKALVKNPVNKQMLAWYDKKRPKKTWRLSFLDDVARTAYLRLDSFSGEGASDAEQAAARFRGFMDESLAKMAKKQTQHLILDVRNNSGGWDIQGVELFTYLMKSDSAVRYYTRLHTVTDSSEFLQFSDLPAAILKTVKQQLIPEKDGTFTEKEDDDSRELRPQFPKPNRFRGQVYILMNGHSGSTTSEFLAVAHANRVGVLVGEESGGAYEGGNGGSFINLKLPHSGIEVTTPLVYYDNAVGEPHQKGRGTMPNHTVSFTLDNLLKNTDDQLDFVKKLIREQGK